MISAIFVKACLAPSFQYLFALFNPIIDPSGFYFRKKMRVSFKNQYGLYKNCKMQKKCILQKKYCMARIIRGC
ncbi:MAG: hypothetical protein CR984_03385 [Proteobacteria bacterium]|nr:MAG: hypothetical protein CR984_03385 [Pseudomonadota bacterium]PIE67147.1 MAG: hypothetical protein CSA23_05730 [Deltaproteobacteria bacterium]